MKHSVKTNREFRYAYRKGKKIVSDILVFHYYINRTSSNKIGITVTKTVGNAVVRNRVKRLIRESYYLRQDELKKGYNIIIVARTKAAFSSFEKVKNALDYCIRKSELI